MGKLLTRLILLVLVGLVAYLYVQVIDLQHANLQLESQVKRVVALESENTQLKARLMQRPIQTADASQTDWIGAAHDHILNAEQAVAKGNFSVAMKETQDANLSLSRAADHASAESRQTVQDLRSQLNEVQTKAKSIWSTFGG